MKAKRLLALLGAILLFAMYACTLIFALMDHSAAQGLLKASIACTFILPVLLYAYTLVYRVTRDTSGPKNDVKDDTSASEKIS